MSAENRYELKFVLAGREDYDWALDQVRTRDLAARCPILFSPVHGSLDGGEMARWVLEDRLSVRVQLQLHKMCGLNLNYLKGNI